MSDEYLRTLQNLVELFPTMDREVIDIVLRDNGGLLEPSMTALLSMNDPEYKQDQQEVDRQEGLQRDAEFARKLVEKELTRNTNNNLSRTTSGRKKGRRRYTDGENVALPMHNVAGLNGMTTTTSSWQPSQARHDKKPSKIRNIFKFGHSSSQHKKEGGASSDHQPTQLDSDFSDSSARSQPQQQQQQQQQKESRRRRRPAPLKQPQKTDTEDVFGLFDDNNDGLSSYTPLSPSKHVPKSPPPAVLPSNDREATAVDLEHPFGLSPPSQTLEQQHGDDTPVMQQTQTSPPQSPKHGNNPFLDQPNQMVVDDTNPFRARNKNLQ